MYGVDFIHNVKVTPLVAVLFKRACKLLHRLNKNLLALAIHFKALGERVCFTLDETLACQYHVALNLVCVDVHLARCLVIRLHSAVVRVFLLRHHGFLD